MAKPNLRLISKWIDALRSRKYKQGEGRLCILKEERIEEGCVETNHAVDLYCCLGVVQTIVDPEHVCLKEGYAFLPNKTLEKIGIDHNFENILSHMNDSGYKFYRIARFLERRFFPGEQKK